MKIPIENIYYLLCYAWNKLDEKDKVNISVDDKTELLDLFAKILINASKTLLKRGIDKNYNDYTEEILGIKGKLRIAETLKRNILFKQKTICDFDDFSANIISNRILVTTIYRLTRTKGVDKDLKNELVLLLKMFNEISQIEISNSLFKQIKINRNNHFYGFIMNVCKIIFENTLPSEEQGRYKFTDFTRDEHKMNQLFEAFVRNFYRIEQKTYTSVRREIIQWNFEKSENNSNLPQMETDITLENETDKIIIDTKYYAETMTDRFGTEKIKSSNLYQLFSYLLNQEDDTQKTQKSTGILLYPTVINDYDLKYRYKNHSIQIRTINLNQNWMGISKKLIEIIA